jgi:hypothetical protein
MQLQVFFNVGVAPDQRLASGQMYSFFAAA